MSQLPAWDDDDAMEVWLNEKLDDQLTDDINEANKIADHGKIRDWLVSDGPALETAEKNWDPIPLRKRYPEIARWINPPKLPQGKHIPSRRQYALDDDDLKVRAAVADILRIRNLWRKHYRRVRRTRGETSAEFFAAKRWDVSEEKVRNRMKK